jgi:glutamate-1-semialdehyde 2,1-aminomutase
MPAGVQSNVRVFAPYPLFASNAKDARLFDVDGNEYIDFCMGYGAIFLGHAHPRVCEAVREQVAKGSIYGTSHELEIKLAQKVVDMVPCADMVRFCNSGTEALMHAVRIARAYTRRNKIVKFEGHYHGFWDSLYVGVKSPFDKPMSAGITTGATRDTIVLPFNNIEIVEKVIKQYELAAIVLEPVMGSGGSGIAADLDFLKALRELTLENGIVLIFDEVITGFRFAPGGAQEFFGVIPDMACLGKILGGGYPVGAIAGKREIMEIIDTTRQNVQRWECASHGGTFCGNPITMVAGLATLEEIAKAEGRLNNYVIRLADKARKELNECFERCRVKAQAIGVGPALGIYFTDQKIKDARALMTADEKMRVMHNTWLIAHGIWHPNMHSWHISTAHTEEDIEALVRETEEFINFVKCKLSGMSSFSGADFSRITASRPSSIL